MKNENQNSEKKDMLGSDMNLQDVHNKLTEKKDEQLLKEQTTVEAKGSNQKLPKDGGYGYH